MSEPTFTVRIAFSSDPLDSSPSWTTVSGVRHISISRGRNHELDRMEAGRATVALDNRSGDFWPENSAGDYYGDIKVMKRINIRATLDAVTYDLFTGYIESWRPGWLGKGGYGSIMTLQCADAFKIFAQQALNDGTGYSQEASGTRVGNVLDDISWPAADRDIDGGDQTLQATGGLVNINALGHLQKVQDSELSLFYIAPDGDAQYEARSHRTASPHTVSQASFGDGELPVVDFKYSLDEVFLFNDVRLTREGGAEQTSSSAASQTAYGKRSLIRTGLYNSTDIAVELLADYLVARYSDSVGRLSSFKVVPSSGNSIWPQIMAREISDRITFIKTAAGIDADYFIERIVLDFDLSNKDFSAEYGVSNAGGYLNEPDAKTETIRPNAAGDADEFNGDVTDIDDVTPDDDTTIIAVDATRGSRKGLFNLPSSAYSTGIINSVTVYARLKRTGAIAAGFTFIKVKTGGTESDGPDITITTSWADYSRVMTVNPVTAAAWTWAEINALQIGMNLWGQFPSGPESQCTQMYAVVTFTPQW